jgi:hypothetical protein
LRTLHEKDRNQSVFIPFALQISAVPEEASGCSIKALPAWSWHRAYMDVFTQHLNSIAHWPWLIFLDNLGAGFTASFNGHPEVEFSSTMSILIFENAPLE